MDRIAIHAIRHADLVFLTDLFSLPEPGLHRVGDSHKLVLGDDVRDHAVHVADERTGENAVIVGEIDETFERLPILHFDEEGAAHHANVGDAVVMEGEQLALGDFLYALDF